MDVDSRRDVSESWRGPLQNDYSRSGSQHFDGTRSGPWHRHHDSREEILYPTGSADWNGEFVWVFDVFGSPRVSVHETATLGTGTTTVGASSADIQDVTETYDEKYWDNYKRDPGAYNIDEAWPEDHQITTARQYTYTADHDTPTYDAGGYTGGASTHDVRVRERSDSNHSYVRVNLFRGALEYPEGPLYNLRHVWFMQEPSVTTKRYDYHEKAQFTPEGKQGWYTSDLVTHLSHVVNGALREDDLGAVFGIGLRWPQHSYTTTGLGNGDTSGYHDQGWYPGDYTPPWGESGSGTSGNQGTGNSGSGTGTSGTAAAGRYEKTTYANDNPPAQTSGTFTPAGNTSPIATPEGVPPAEPVDSGWLSYLNPVAWWRWLQNSFKAQANSAVDGWNVDRRFDEQTDATRRIIADGPEGEVERAIGRVQGLNAKFRSSEIVGSLETIATAPGTTIGGPPVDAAARRMAVGVAATAAVGMALEWSDNVAPRRSFAKAGETLSDGVRIAPEYSGIIIRNKHLAGKLHPVTGIPFDAGGFPDFSSVAKHTVDIQFTGNSGRDFALANKAAGLASTPKDYTWHHHQNGTTMQLVPRDIHRKTGHTGWYAWLKNKLSS